MRPCTTSPRASAARRTSWAGASRWRTSPTTPRRSRRWPRSTSSTPCWPRPTATCCSTSTTSYVNATNHGYDAAGIPARAARRARRLRPRRRALRRSRGPEDRHPRRCRQRCGLGAAGRGLSPVRRRSRRCSSATSTSRRSPNWRRNSARYASDWRLRGTRDMQPERSADDAGALLRAQQTRSPAYIRDPAHVAPPEGIEERRLKVYRDLFFNNIASTAGGQLSRCCTASSATRAGRRWCAISIATTAAARRCSPRSRASSCVTSKRASAARRSAVAAGAGALRMGGTRAADQRGHARGHRPRRRRGSHRRQAGGVAAGLAARLRLAGAPHRSRLPAGNAARQRDPAAAAPRDRWQGQLPRTQWPDLPPAAATRRGAAAHGTRASRRAGRRKPARPTSRPSSARALRCCCSCIAKARCSERAPTSDHDTVCPHLERWV